jgi:hypothetical protein
LWTLSGVRTNEVFYDNVLVPKKNLVGEKNRGFYYMMTALEFERVLSVGGLRRVFEEVVGYVKERPALNNDTLIRQKIAEIGTEIEVAKLFVYRLAWLQTKRIVANYEAAALKLFASELWQRLANSAMEILGLHGQLQRNSKWAPLSGRIERLSRESIFYTFAGGTSEVMRNIIATRGLGLPR